MTKIFDVENYEPKNTEEFFFDTNIWFYIYAPMGNHRKDVIKKYSNFLAKLLKNKSKILVSPLLFSELFNAYVRTEFNIS